MGAIFVVLAGTTYQGVATALERRQLPHPGRLIDVGGHQLHLDCSGEGHPIVVLEAPSMGMSAVWGWIRQDLTSRTRVCAYDRSGLGWSEAGDSDYDPSRAIDELHVLLERATEASPYVLVGHEFGAALAAAYATRYRSDLAALVLIDPPAAERWTGSIIHDAFRGLVAVVGAGGRSTRNPLALSPRRRAPGNVRRGGERFPQPP